jgi:hypothetical protein
MIEDGALRSRGVDMFREQNLEDGGFSRTGGNLTGICTGRKTQRKRQAKKRTLSAYAHAI